MPERIWAIVPIKPLAEAKSRLAPALTPEARRQLTVRLLHHTLSVLTQVETLAGVLVVSADDAVGRIAQAHDAAFLPEPEAPGLNVSLTVAADQAQAWGATGVLIVPGDLPQLDVASLEAVLTAAPTSPALVIVPDRRERGTNVLLLKPPDLLPFRYGPGSFRRHLALAGARDVQPIVRRFPNLAIDADLPQDLDCISPGWRLPS
mgnify:FL=1